VSADTPIQQIKIAGQYYVLMPFGEYRELEMAAKALSSSFSNPSPIDEVKTGSMSPKAGESPLRFWRKRRKMTVKQLAQSAGVKAHMLYQIEQNARQGNIKTWCSLSKALGVSVEEIAPKA
jgi:DNA-binding XRE family transcriptional regulator